MKPASHSPREKGPALDSLPTNFTPPPVPRAQRPVPLALALRLARPVRCLTNTASLRRDFTAQANLPQP